MTVVVCIMGPTASGKTDLAVKLLANFPFEIISVDSALIYRGMDVGTAKPNQQELSTAPHRLINICDPDQVYSAGNFVNDATTEIDRIVKQKKIPLLVGGTMLYFRALQFGLAELPTASEAIRQKLTNDLARDGLQLLYKRLMSIDPDSAERIHPNDPQRILRALEVYEQTGQTLSELQQATKPLTDYEFINIGLIPEDRAKLHAIIEKRFQQMLANGLIDEVKHLKLRGNLDLNKPSMRAVGYRQVWQYLDNQLTYDEMCERAIIATRQLAKRQLTWLRSWPNLHSFDCFRDDLFLQVKDCLEAHWANDIEIN